MGASAPIFMAENLFEKKAPEVFRGFLLPAEVSSGDQNQIVAMDNLRLINIAEQ